MLVEGSGRAGLGTAFSTPEEAHLLNVPAAKMGAWADKPDDFAEAVAADGYEPDDYLPRKRLRRISTNILNEARASGLVKLVSSDGGRPSASRTAG